MITRSDIPENYQSVQAAHSSISFQYEHPDVANTWNKESKYLIQLSIKNYNEFKKFLYKLIDNDIRFSLFYEPDISEYTSVTIEPGEKSKKLTSSLPLMLKNKK